MPGEDAHAEFLRLFERAVSEFRPDVLLANDGAGLAEGVIDKASAEGIATVLSLRDLCFRDSGRLAAVDAVLVPSRFLADFYEESFGVACTVLPAFADLPDTRPDGAGKGYATLVDPSIAGGLYAFARIADVLGGIRPDIPLLVIEGEETEAALAGCGLDLRVHCNVHFMPRPPDPRRSWQAIGIALLPSLDWSDRSGLVSAALASGAPVIGSDRAGIPESLGGSGIILPLPGRMTPATRVLPTADEVAPWVDAIIRLWDDNDLHAAHRRRSLTEAGRRSFESLGPRHIRFLSGVRAGEQKAPIRPPGRTKAVVLVPHLNGIEWECERGLQELERSGVRVIRMGGSSAIDLARCVLASNALHDRCESLLFIDADLGFEHHDALRLLARPEPVVAGIYVKKSRREIASIFAEGIVEVRFGPQAEGLYPLQYAAAGFLRIRADVLHRMIRELELPFCNARWGRGFWPFFQPAVVPLPDGQMHYLSEDWAFSHRLSQIGITPMADTTVRLWHYGRYGFGWEDAGGGTQRHDSYLYRSSENPPG